MTSPASVVGDERLRLFLALRLPEEALDALAAWQREHLQGVRVVPREHLHVTLAFLGSRPAAELDGILGVLREAAGRADAGIELAPVRYRETRSAGMVVFGDAGGRAAALAEDVQAGLERLGVYRREGRPCLPHVTVARFRRRPRLQADVAGVRTFVPSDGAAYLSRLRPGGAQYDVLEAVGLGRLGHRARVGGE